MDFVRTRGASGAASAWGSVDRIGKPCKGALIGMDHHAGAALRKRRAGLPGVGRSDRMRRVRALAEAGVNDCDDLDQGLNRRLDRCV